MSMGRHHVYLCHRTSRTLYCTLLTLKALQFFFLKIMGTKGFFQFEIIIKVFVSSF